MSNKPIDGGYIILAKRIIESELWQKPAAYLKIWIYILLKVNFKNTTAFPRGTGLFNFSQEKIPGVTLNQVYEFLRWAKTLNPRDSTTQITTQKTTRGIVLKVNNYTKYQDINNYCHQDRNQNKKQHITNTITGIKKERERYINISLSNSEREILKNYLLSKPRKEPIYDLDAYIAYLKKNKTLKAKLEKALKWHENLEPKKKKAKNSAENSEVQESKEVSDAAFEEFKKAARKIRGKK